MSSSAVSTKAIDSNSSYSDIFSAIWQMSGRSRAILFSAFVFSFLAGANLGPWIPTLVFVRGPAAVANACDPVGLRVNGKPPSAPGVTKVSGNVLDVRWDSNCPLTVQLFNGGATPRDSVTNDKSPVRLMLPKIQRYEVKLADDRSGRGYPSSFSVERTR